MNGLETLKNKKLFLFDMDGTIYLDNDLFDGVIDLLSHIKQIGGKYLFLTNNSSKSVDKYVEKLKNLNIVSTKEDFLTSVDATIFYLKGKNYNKIYALGTKSFKEQLKNSGLNIVDCLVDGIDCLLMGFDTELSFSKLEDACKLLNNGVDYIATNPDLVCPTSYGYVPDCGSVAIMLENATKRKPTYIGKPEPKMVEMALEKSGFSKDQAVLIGDRLYTDIACGVNAGISTIFVLSGEGTLEDLETSEKKPTYVLKDVQELYNILKSN